MTPPDSHQRPISSSQLQVKLVPIAFLLLSYCKDREQVAFIGGNGLLSTQGLGLGLA